MLEWYNSRFGRYKIIEIKKERYKERYIVDTYHSKPKILLLATSPKIVTFKVTQIALDDYNLNKNDSRLSIGTLSIVLITQPLVTLIYNLGKNLFINYSISEQMIFKALLFILSVISSVIMYIIISHIDKYKIGKTLGEENIADTHELIIKTKGQKNYSIISLLVLLSLVAAMYFKSQDGTEAILLCIASIITFGFMFISRYIAQTNYKDLAYQISQLK